MPIHDWSKGPAGLFHHFHQRWAISICDALNAGRSFDFEGSGIRGVEKYYRRWGAPARPVWQLKKDGSLRGWLARAAYHEFGAANGRAASRGNAGKTPHATEKEGAPAQLDRPRQVEKLPVRIARSIMRWRPVMTSGR